MPIGAVVAGQSLMHTFTDNPILGHISTFGGHPVIAAAALSGIKVLMDSGLIAEVDAKEKLFRKLLVHPQIADLSGKGLMLAIVLDSFENNLKVIQGCMHDGIITDWFLFANNRIRIAPPLTISVEEIEMACSIIIKHLDIVYG